MSSSGSGARVSIPSSVRKTIQDIKEITGNHSEDEIYAMLRECSMDPNETAQKLLMQDTFHEVKRKRDRRRENVIRDPPESRLRPGVQGRGVRGGRGNYSPRPISHDAGGGKNPSGKENGARPVSEKVSGPSALPTSQKAEFKDSVASSAISPVAAPIVQSAHSSAAGRTEKPEVTVDAGATKSYGPLPVLSSIEAKNSGIASGTKEIHRQQKPSSFDTSAEVSSEPSSTSFSASDPVLFPSQDSRPASSVGTIRRQGFLQNSAGHAPSKANQSKSTLVAASGIESSNTHGKMLSKSQGFEKNQPLESSQTASSHGGSFVSKPSSSYSNRTQVIGPLKVGPNKEWKPKPLNPSLSQDSGVASASKVPLVSAEDNNELQPSLSSFTTEDATLELQRKLEGSHISDGAHVVIPNHIHVPEVEKLGFCFGSFDASFGLTATKTSVPESIQSPPHSETSEVIEETAEQSASDQSALGSAEGEDYPEHRQSPSQSPEKMLSNENEVSSSVVPEYTDVKQETAHGSQHYSAVHNSPNYSFGFMPPLQGSQPTPLDSSGSQARDVSRLTNFVVQQPFDPASYYAQFYRSGAESDGRISPLIPSGVATKYNGNIAAVSAHASQSLQEGGNPLAMSTASPAPLVTQSSMAVTQPLLPVIRQPTGLHLPHYPPNYIPYGHYFPPFYVPPPAIHQFLSNGAFPQQPQAGNVYAPSPLGAAKFSLSQYKPGAIAGNMTHMGVPGSYGPYGSSTNYNTSSPPAAGNPTSSEDLVASQFKENNVLVSGQQSEGSGVWISTPGRDISSLQASSFYNLPPGQVVFPPTQPGHGGFTSIYHPAQPVTATTVQPFLQQSHTMTGPGDMVGPAATVYQQAQHSQINWPSNY